MNEGPHEEAGKSEKDSHEAVGNAGLVGGIQNFQALPGKPAVSPRPPLDRSVIDNVAAFRASSKRGDGDASIPTEHSRYIEVRRELHKAAVGQSFRDGELEELASIAKKRELVAIMQASQEKINEVLTRLRVRLET